MRPRYGVRRKRIGHGDYPHHAISSRRFRRDRSDIESLVFKSRREARVWCAEHHPGSPIREVGANSSKREPKLRVSPEPNCGSRDYLFRPLRRGRASRKRDERPTLLRREVEPVGVPVHTQHAHRSYVADIPMGDGSFLVRWRGYALALVTTR
jgi:hypothetical protein